MISAIYVIGTIELLDESDDGKDVKSMIDELLDLYPSTDFKLAVQQVANEFNYSPLNVVLLYMKRTGTLSSGLPDSYSLKDFVGGQDQSSASSSGGEEEGSNEYSDEGEEGSDEYSDEGDYASDEDEYEPEGSEEDNYEQ